MSDCTCYNLSSSELAAILADGGILVSGPYNSEEDCAANCCNSSSSSSSSSDSLSSDSSDSSNSSSSSLDGVFIGVCSNLIPEILHYTDITPGCLPHGDETLIYTGYGPLPGTGYPSWTWQSANYELICQFDGVSSDTLDHSAH